MLVNSEEEKNARLAREKRELYNMLSRDVARPLKRRRVSEDDVLEDFEASRKKRRHWTTLTARDTARNRSRECEFYRRTMNSTANWREGPGRPAYAVGGVPKVPVT